MTVAPIARMLWKEYRSLRMLWVGCLLGTLGLWALLSGVTSLYGGRSPHDQAELMHVYWSLSLWLPAIYLLGCTVATFAGEKEERTADWLIHVAVPIRPTIAVKLLWPVASAAVMQLLLFGVTLLIRQYFLSSLTGYGREPALTLPADETLPDMPRLATFALLEALVWGLFWSLQLSKPMPAAVVAAVCIVAVNLSTVNAMATPWERHFEPWSLLRTLLVIGLFLADLVLARRWLTGRGWQWSIPWDRFRIRRKSFAATAAVEHAAEWRRAWQRFRWLEWQTIRIFLAFVVIAAMATAVPLFLWPQHGGSNALTFMLGFFLPLAAGLTAWQGDQSRQQFRFLVNRGVSPLGLWLNKFGLWLLTLCVAVVLLACAASLGYVCGQYVQTQRFDLQLWVTQFFQRNVDGWRFAPQISLSYLGLFAGAFAISPFFQRGIYSFAAALLLQSCLACWFGSTSGLQLPIWLGIVPVLVWLVWCSVRQLPRWYLERTGWRTRAAQLADWLVFPLLLAATVTVYWVYSIPSPDVEQMIANYYQRGAANNTDAEWAEVRQKSIQLSTRRYEMALRDEVVSRLPDDQWPQWDDEVSAFRDALLKPNAITRNTKFFEHARQDGLVGYKSVILAMLMSQLAERELAAGQTDDSLRSVRAAVRYAGVLYVDAPPERRDEPHNVLHWQLMSWAEHPANTPQIVQEALSVLERQELRWWITDVPALEGQYRQALQGNAQFEKELGSKAWLFRPALTRQRRLAACIFSNELRFLQTPSSLRGLAHFPPPLTDIDQDAAWATRGLAYSATESAPGAPVGLTPQRVAMLWDRETRIRCTFAAMAAVAYRRAHGRLPKHLREVVPEFASAELLADPWAPELLQVEPEGLSGPMIDTSLGHTFEEGVPFVWSVGPFGVRISERVGYASPGKKEYQFSSTRPVPWSFYGVPHYVFAISAEDRPADAFEAEVSLPPQGERQEER